MKLLDLLSGTIDIVGGRLQFNCSCDDALPYCEARCCKGRPEWNIEVSDEDAVEFVWAETVDGRVIKTLPIVGEACGYLDGDNRCGVYALRPGQCKGWHCSPGGVGADIMVRANGWKLAQ